MTTPREKKRTGRRYTQAEFETAIRAAGGLLSVAARKLGCEVSTVRRAVKRTPALRRVVDELREIIIDTAEATLIALSKRRDKLGLTASIYLTKALPQGRARGYAERPSEARYLPRDVSVNAVILNSDPATYVTRLHALRERLAANPDQAGEATLHTSPEAQANYLEIVNRISREAQAAHRAALPPAPLPTREAAAVERLLAGLPPVGGGDTGADGEPDRGEGETGETEKV